MVDEQNTCHPAQRRDAARGIYVLAGSDKRPPRVIVRND